MKNALLAGMSALALMGAGWAQTVNGTLTGIITDPSQAVVAGAKVSAKNRSTSIGTQTQTSMAGVYTLSLPPATYDVTIELAGFKTLVRERVEININQTSRLDLRLELGAVSDRVTVEASAPLLENETSELGMVVRSQAVLDLPLSTPGQRRMADTFTLLIPGVNPGTGGNGGSFAAIAWNSGGQWTTNGSQRDSKDILYDGVSIGELGSGGRSWAQSPPPDSIQEFKMLTGSYSAEFGGSAGGVVSITTRSGGNELHGSAYDFLRNDKLHARGFFTPNKAKDRQNEFGATLGGPIYVPKLYDGRNRTFFFAFYNGLRWRTAAANELVTVPPPAFLQGDFSGYLDGQGKQRLIFDPASNRPDGKGGVVRDQFPGNRIPADRFSKVSQKIAALLPQPMYPRQTLNFVGVRTTLSDDDRWEVKIDHSLSGKQRMSGVFSHGDFVRDGSGPLPQRYFSGFTTRDEPAKVVRLSHDYTITPRFINHFSAGYNRDAPFTGNTSTAGGWAEKLGLRGTNDPKGAFPHVTFGDDVEYGMRLSGEANSYSANQSFIFSDTASLVRGKHSMRFGGDARRYHRNSRSLNRIHGTFSFSPSETQQPNSATRQNTGSALASFVLGAVDNGTVYFPTTTSGLRNTYYALFYQDDYKITRRLTLNLGLRYEIGIPVTEVADRFSVFSPTTPNPGAGGLPGALVFAGKGPGRTGRSGWAETDWKEFGPRFGFAFQPFSGTVLRGGYGIFYAVSGNSGYSSLGYNTQPAFTSTDTGITPGFYWDNGFPQDFPKPPFIDPSFANNQDVSWIRAEDGAAPYVQNWHFGIQRQITGSLMADVAYVGSKGTRLGSQNTRLNQVHADLLRLGNLLTANVTSQAAKDAGIKVPYPGFSGTVNQALRPFPQFRNISVPGEKLGMSNYNSLQVRVQKRYSQGLHFTVAYTLSKKLDDAGESQSPGNNGGPIDYYNLRIEKSLSMDDSTHILAIGYAYELPVGAGKRFLNSHGVLGRHVLGGWQLSGMSRYMSGFPLRISGGNSLPIFGGQRPTYVGGQPIRTSVSAGDFDPAKDVWLNRNAFSNGPQFTFGNVPRTLSVRGFPFYDESFGILKKTAIRERAAIEFRAEFYNFLNRVNLSPPQTSINSSAFGMVSSQLGNPRQAQLGLRVSF